MSWAGVDIGSEPENILTWFVGGSDFTITSQGIWERLSTEGRKYNSRIGPNRESWLKSCKTKVRRNFGQEASIKLQGGRLVKEMSA